MVFQSTLPNLIFFVINSFLVFACAYRMKKVYNRSQVDHYKYFFGFFFTFGLFFSIIWLIGFLFWQDLEMIKLGFIISQFFLFLSLGLFLVIPASIWFPDWKKIPLFIFPFIGLLNIAVLSFAYKKNPLIIGGFISWQLPAIMGWFAFVTSALVAGSSAVFFLRGASMAVESVVKKRSYFFAIASLLLLISAYFWVGFSSPALPIAYITGVVGYFITYLGVYLIKGNTVGN